MGEEKSIDVILKSIAPLLEKSDNIKFLLVGDGPSKEPLEQLTKDLSLENKVIFTGKVPWNEVPKYYNIADVFVNASLTETQGLTFLEAMAAGVPVIARYAPNLTEFIKTNQNGILIRNPNDFPKIINSLLNNKELYEKISNESIKTANDYSVEKFGDNLENLYKEVIKSYKLKKGLSKNDRIKERKSLYKRLTSTISHFAKL